MFSPVIGADYLLDALKALRFAWPVEGGVLPLPWQEIHAYAQATGELIEAWEFHAIASMSAAYCRGRMTGENQFGRFPSDEDDENV